MTFGSLFAGIGGIDLGLERAGLQCEWQVEIDHYCLNVLHKHWPDVPKWRDVQTWPPKGLAPGDFYVDLICGGFPCQDISLAGRGAGIDGTRSGLWREFTRVIRALRPRYALMENSPALRGRGIGRILQDLADCGYDAEWDCLPAMSFGAIHIRNRLFLLAYPNGEHATKRRHRPLGRIVSEEGIEEAHRQGNGHANGRRHGASQEAVFSGRGGIELSNWWASEPNVGRVAYGIPAALDRRKCLGNAVVPQCSEFIGRLIMEHANNAAERIR